MLEKIDVTSKVYTRLAVKAGPHQSLSAAIDGLLDLAEKYEADRKKLKEWEEASELSK